MGNMKLSFKVAGNLNSLLNSWKSERKSLQSVVLKNIYGLNCFVE